MGPSEPRKDPFAPAADPSAPLAARRGLRLAGLAVVLLALLAVLAAVLLWPDGAYPRLPRDHDALMVSKTPKPASTVTVLFVGNSLTFTNDLPAMLVNLASSDPGDTVRLQVKAVTFPDASLDDMFNKGQALDWARGHHPDYVVLQEHSFWYDGDYEATRAAAYRWITALKTIGAAPLLFEVWTDGEGSDVFKGGSNAAEDALRAVQGTDGLGRSLGVPVVAVGQAFDAARQTPGAPNLYGPDRHHPSVAGSYLGALAFYRYFTGRSGAEAAYRPGGLRSQDAAALVRLNGG
jgi:hypothetical protein